MKLERAQELYTDYLEGTLSPAMKLALEQHFESEAGARADYDEFAMLRKLLSRPVAEVDPPIDFRAKVMERVSIEYGRRQQTPSLWQTISQAFMPQQRRPMAGALVALVGIAAVVSAVMYRSHGGSADTGSILPTFAGPATYESTLRGVELQAVDGYIYHLIDIHLPSSVPKASVRGWVFTSDDQIVDPNARATATSVLPAGQMLSDDEEMKIPIAYTRAVAPGSTLNVMLQWTPLAADPTQHSGAEVIFTPVDANDSTTPQQAAQAVHDNASFYDQLQSVASGYQATVIVDATTVPTQPASAWTPDQTAEQALATVAASEGYAVTTSTADASGKTFIVHPKID